jgi:hypothetical protein
MFTKLSPSLIQSDEGFSIHVQYMRITYIQDPKVLTIGYEPLVIGSEFDMVVYGNDIKIWDSGTPIDEVERKTIVDNVFRALPLLDIKPTLPRNNRNIF